MQAARNHRRTLLLSALGAGALCVLAILAVDGGLAKALTAVSSDRKRLVQQAVGILEVVFGFGVSPYLYGALLVASGSASMFKWKHRLFPWALLFIGLSHVTARFATGILKPPFSRLRPFESFGPDGWHDTWFSPPGNSFPSGHAAHFWSLFFPLAILFPRFRLALAIVPVFVSAARVAVNDHYLSDVLASAALAALITWAYATVILERGRHQIAGSATLARNPPKGDRSSATLPP